jgi:streptogramin lyase
MKQALRIPTILLTTVFIFTLSLLILPQVHSSNDSLVFRQSWGAEGGRFRWANDLAVAPDGTIYVAEIEYNRITIITKERNFLVWENEGRFGAPRSVALDKAGNVFVVDSDDKIYKLSPDGELLTEWGTSGSGPGQFDWPSRIAVDSNGNVYVLDAHNERVQKFTNSGTYLTQWNGADSDGGVLVEPSGLDVDKNNHVYVSTESGRVIKFDATGNALTEWTAVDYDQNWTTDIAVDDENNVYLSLLWEGQIQKYTKAGRHLSTIGTRGSNPGEFKFSYGIATGYDRNGNAALFVADTGNNRVQMLSPDGDYHTEWGPEGTYVESCNVSFHSVWISEMAVDDKYIYLTGGDTEDVIQTCTHDGSLLFTWGGSEQIGQIGDLASDSDGNVYVADMLQDRIHKFDSNGNYLMGWGSSGSGPGQFNSAFGIGVDQRTNDVYVIDSIYSGGNERIQKFDSNGNYLLQWGSPGSEPGQFTNPQEIVVDDMGNVYVSDSVRIQKFTGDGTFLLQWGGTGSGPGEFLYSYYIGLAIDSDNNIFATDTGNHRIQKFSSNGAYLSELGEFGYEPGQFSSPYDVGVDDQDNVFVYEFHGGRIQKFSPGYPSADPVSGLIQNGSFEEDPLFDEWTYGGDLPVSRHANATQGNYSMLLGQSTAQDAKDKSSGWTYQTIYVDPTWERPMLSFRYNMHVNDTIDFSDFFVEIQDGLGLNHLQTVVRDGFRPCGSDQAPPAATNLGWRQRQLDLSSYKGQTVRIVFQNRNLWSGYSLGIWTFVDDVRVTDADPLPVPGPYRTYLPSLSNYQCDF